MIYNMEIENLQIQECSLKSRSFWTLVISLETYEAEKVISGLCYIEYVIFLENNIALFSNSLDI